MWDYAFSVSVLVVAISVVVADLVELPLLRGRRQPLGNVNKARRPRTPH